jgi:hypothetical protein
MRGVIPPLNICIHDVHRNLHFTLSQDKHTLHKITDAVKSLDVDCEVKVNAVSIFKTLSTTTKRGAEANLVPLYFCVLFYTNIIFTDGLTDCMEFNDTVWTEAAL